MTYILADNQDLTRFAVESLIRQSGDSRTLRVSDRAGLVEALKAHESAVVVLDYTLFDIADEEQLLIISEYSSHRFSIVFKDEQLKSLRDALRSASAGQRFISQRAMEIILAQQTEEKQPDVLTATERDIVRAIAKGLTTKEIAEERFSSVHTITTHRKNIFRKLGVNTAHEVVKYALRAGLVESFEF